jgi:hypothetical protein
MEWFDGLDREQVKAVIEFTARSLDMPSAYAPKCGSCPIRQQSGPPRRKDATGCANSELLTSAEGAGSTYC